MRRRGLAPGEGFAVPLFGEAESVALALFAVGAPEAALSHEAACPACGGTHTAPCRFEALSLGTGPVDGTDSDPCPVTGPENVILSHPARKRPA